MKKEAPELQEIIDDLTLIKEAVGKSDSIIRFMDTGGALRSILLVGGLLIAVFSVVFHFLMEKFGSFAGTPFYLRTILFVLIALSVCGVGYLKITNFLRGARKIGVDLTVYRLFADFFPARHLAWLLPNLAAIVFLLIFLAGRGLGLYIIPFLAVLYGLLTITLSCFFFLKAFYLLGIWLTATGLLTLFIAEMIPPPAALGITFAAGFVLVSLPFYLHPPGEKRPRQ